MHEKYGVMRICKFIEIELLKKKKHFYVSIRLLYMVTLVIVCTRNYVKKTRSSGLLVPFLTVYFVFVYIRNLLQRVNRK